jgi:hypothetical protein
MSASAGDPGRISAVDEDNCPFAIRDLSVLAYAQGFTLWHYKASVRVLRRVDQLGFFDDAADMLACGDIVLVSSPHGARILMVAAIEGTVITSPLC